MGWIYRHNRMQKNTGQHKAARHQRTSLHLWMWNLNRFLKEINQLIHNALCCVDRGDHKRIRVGLCQVKLVTEMPDPLHEKNPLGASVSLTKRVQHINRMIKVCYFFRQLAVRQSGRIKPAQPLKASFCTGCNLAGRNKCRPLL